MANAAAWIGQDGNLWYRGNQGVQNWGSAKNYEFTNGGLRSVNQNTPLGQGAGFAPSVSQIDDPVNQPQQQAPAYDSGGGGGAAGPVLNQAAINNTQGTIDQMGSILQRALAEEANKYRNIQSGFGAQKQQQQGQYDESTTTNQQNYDGNLMASIRAGSKGLGGLMSMLRGTGTAEDWARQAVQGTTANDIRMGADTQKENQSGLDNTLSTFLSSLKQKEQEAADTFSNNKRAVTRDSNSQLQSLYEKMAGFYSDADRTADANSWMAKAGGLTPAIARDSVAKTSRYDTAPIKVAAPELTAFSGATDQAVTSSDNSGPGQLGSGIFTIGDEERRRKQQAPVGV